MKILMIAPEPFFEPRGTPFSEYFRIRSLSRLGHEIDLVTYPIGEDKEVPGLTIYRSLKLPFIKSVKTGPSAAKIFLDLFLFFKAAGRLLRKKYDLIHTHEEANIMGAFFSKISGIPHLYDMHSSLVQQMTNFQFTKSRLITSIFRTTERISLKNARSVIVICKSLYDYASEITESEKLTIIENFIDDSPDELSGEKLDKIKTEIEGKERIIISYAGTLETYQGIPMLIDAMEFLDKKFKLILIGGKEEQVKKFRLDIEKRGLSDKVTLLGRKEPEEIPYYLKASDILVSPRILGTNIPLKIYSFLKSGTPLVVTNLYTHTQSITDDIAIIKEPVAEDFAEGIKEAAGKKGKETTKKALEFCNTNYTLSRYDELVKEALSKAVKNK
ncbi:MAG: glycosyltransferase family 4 protein [Acidobacteriota bacterium]